MQITGELGMRIGGGFAVRTSGGFASNTQTQVAHLGFWLAYRGPGHWGGAERADRQNLSINR